jgi:uncharacterized protein YwgA
MEMITKMIMNKETLNELLKELLLAVLQDDEKMKELDKSINPNSHSQAVHLTKTILEYVNQ